MLAREDLGVWRTPVEPAPRLAEVVGLRPGDLWVKRDDWLGFGGGGNKVRKLEVLCAAARAQGAGTLVATGAAQSNFARLSAAAARRLGLEAVLVLAGDGRATRTGNLALDGVFGADVRWAGGALGPELAAAAAAVAQTLEADGRRPFVLPYGGSDGTGAQGYVAAGLELDEQAPDARHVVVAVGSGGTMAGLAVALGAGRVLGIDVGAVADPVVAVDTLAAEAAAVAGRRWPPGQALRLRRDQVGTAYEARTDAAWRAIADAGRTEGLVLDPVYTAKAMAGLAAAVRDGDIRPGERTVFVHTGGLPGFFGHPAAEAFADRAARGDGARR